MWMRRIAGTTLLLWVVTLALPATMHAFEYFGGPIDPESIIGEPGFSYLLFGALGPTVIDEAAYDLPGYAGVPHWAIGGVPLAAFGWYAHPFWAWNMGRMLLGRPPQAIPALLSTLLGALALQPYHIGVFDDHGVNSMAVPTYGAFLWAAAMAVPLAVLVFTRLARRA